MICILGVSHRDKVQALRWLDHVWALSLRERGEQPPVIVMQTMRAAAESGTVLQTTKLHVLEWAVCPDENEVGYPIAASHLFLRAFEFAERVHPHEPILWLEADTLPMWPGWRQKIKEEYLKHGRPFMGYIERAHGFAHMAGCGVYPSDWRTRAPLLANVLAAPDVFWGKGLGQAFDTYAAPEIVPQAAHSKTIQQIWRPSLPMTLDWLRRNIAPGVALFHQVKDNSGFKSIQAGLKL